MSLPYKRIPAGIAAYTDPTGKLPASQLSHVDGIGDFQIQAARAMRALQAAAKADGLIVASVGDYRSYDEQVRLFEQRYEPVYHAGARHYTWKGQTWYLKPGAAGAAYPGTSNHGLGLANDMALNVNGHIVTLDQTVNGVSLWTWLNAHGRTYGWSWGEAASERWHWVYIEGDQIPAAVIAYETSPIKPPEDDMPLSDDDLNKIASKITAILRAPEFKVNFLPQVVTQMAAVEPHLVKQDTDVQALHDDVLKIPTTPAAPGSGGGLTEQQVRDLLNSQRITTDEP